MINEDTEDKINAAKYEQELEDHNSYLDMFRDVLDECLRNLDKDTNNEKLIGRKECLEELIKLTQENIDQSGTGEI